MQHDENMGLLKTAGCVSFVKTTAPLRAALARRMYLKLLFQGCELSGAPGVVSHPRAICGVVQKRGRRVEEGEQSAGGMVRTVKGAKRAW